MKRALMVLLVLSLFAFISTGVFALSCSIQAGACNSGYELMRVSDTTNAHGANIASNPAGYKYVCCDTPGSLTCSADGNSDGNPDNKVLGLSSITNAHAEIPSLNNYATDICYGDWSCVSTQTTCPAGTDAILSLSADTNAHIGPATGTGSYNTKICCSTSQPLPCELTDAYWSIDSKDIDKQSILSGYSALTGQTVYLVVKGNNCNGKTVSFEVWRDDPISDNKITTVSMNFKGGEAVATWDTIYHSNPYYFIARVVLDGLSINTKDKGKPLLKVLQESVIDYCSNSGNPLGAVAFCGSYYTGNGQTKENACRGDKGLCDVAKKSAGTDINGVPVDCSPSSGNDCYCSWVPATEECYGTFDLSGSTYFCGDGSITGTENCDPDSGTLNLDRKPLCTDFNGYTSLGTSTAPGCSAGGNNPCQFVLQSYCSGVPTCGNGVIETQIGEECDGNTFGVGGNLCSSQGFTSGTMTCSTGAIENGGCKLIKTNCQNPLSGGACGDGTKQATNGAGQKEQCDRADGMTGKDCSSVSGGFYDDNVGTLSCSGFCRYDVSKCTKDGKKPSQLTSAELCGNGILDSSAEECDKTDFGIYGQSCTGLGYKSGDLQCNNDCTINKNSCIEPAAADSIKGKCTIIPSSTDEDGCNDGTISYSWTAKWDPGTQLERPASCPDGPQQQVLQCPSLVQLPFFDALQFIITALAISAIYAVMILRERKKRN